MKLPYFINRLGSDNQVDFSVQGVNGARTGTPVYDFCKFGKGLDSPTGANYVIFTNAITAPTQGVVEWWWKPKFASTRATNGDIINIENAVPEQFHILWLGSLQGIQIYFWEGSYKSRYNFTPSFSANELMHMAVEFDSNQSATNRIKLYKNGIEESSTINDDGTWAFGNMDIQMRQKWFGVTDSIFDQVKAHDNTGDIQLILDNANNERFGLNDAEILV